MMFNFSTRVCTVSLSTAKIQQKLMCIRQAYLSSMPILKLMKSGSLALMHQKDARSARRRTVAPIDADAALQARFVLSSEIAKSPAT